MEEMTMAKKKSVKEKSVKEKLSTEEWSEKVWQTLDLHADCDVKRIADILLDDINDSDGTEDQKKMARCVLAGGCFEFAFGPTHDALIAVADVLEEATGMKLFGHTAF